MSFKFSEIEGFDSELAAKLDADESVTSAIGDHVASSVTARVDVAKGEFKTKMDAMAAKVTAAEQRAANAPDIDADELEALKQARDKNPELVATLEQIKKKAADAEKALEERSAQVQAMQLDHEVTRAINEYDAQNPTVALNPDAKDLVGILARDALRFDEGAKAFRVFDKSGNVIATDQGAATPVNFIESLRKDRPSMFKQPAGSGAKGSDGSGAGGGEKTMTRSEFGKLPPGKQSEVARGGYQITEG